MKNRDRDFILDMTEPEPNSGCWLWTGWRTMNGYGRVRDGEDELGAHRLSYLLFCGDPGGLWVLHRCDTRACVNPKHLFLGTASDNTRDMASKGRMVVPSPFGHSVRRGEAHPNAKLSVADVVDIRRSRLSSRVLAERCAVSASMIRKIRGRRYWTHVLTGSDAGLQARRG